MITLNYFVHKKEGISADDFRNYWLGEHAKQSVDLVGDLGIRKYTKCETQHEDDVNKMMQQIYSARSDVYDFVDQMVINDLEDFKAGLAIDRVQSAVKALHNNAVEYIDLSRCDYWFSIEHPVIFTAADLTATWNNTYLKGFFTVRHYPHLSLEEAQLHWVSCHGALARQFVRFIPYEHYIQGHRIQSKVIDRFKAMLGGGFENTEFMMGMGEGWMDRRIVLSLQGPEFERLMAMLNQDVPLFVDASTSDVFVTKQHVILDKPIITEPLPSLFSAD